MDEQKFWGLAGSGSGSWGWQRRQEPLTLAGYRVRHGTQLQLSGLQQPRQQRFAAFEALAGGGGNGPQPDGATVAAAAAAAAVERTALPVMVHLVCAYYGHTLQDTADQRGRKCSRCDDVEDTKCDKAPCSVDAGS